MWSVVFFFSWNEEKTTILKCLSWSTFYLHLPKILASSKSAFTSQDFWNLHYIILVRIFRKYSLTPSPFYVWANVCITKLAWGTSSYWGLFGKLKEEFLFRCDNIDDIKGTYRVGNRQKNVCTFFLHSYTGPLPVLTNLVDYLIAVLVCILEMWRNFERMIVWGWQCVCNMFKFKYVFIVESDKTQFCVMKIVYQHLQVLDK